MSLLRVKTMERRVGVVGLYNAGKTVFLTSLVDHLEHHDPDRFRLGRPAPGGPPPAVRKFARVPPDPGWAAFNHAGFRDALVHRGRWPEKTRDRSQFACRFERTDWTFSDCLLKLYDLPGERLADAAMVGRSFAAWSDHLLGFVSNDSLYRGCCRPYLDALAAPDADEPALLAAYKLSLGSLILAYKPLVSPSSFWLGPDGSLARGGTAEEIAAGRVVGAAGEEFAPLPEAVRANRPDLAARFAARFDRYRDDVVGPFVEALRGCHALVVLIDVPMLLAAGVGMYDDNRQILRDLFAVLDPGETPLEWAGRHLATVFLPHALRPARINRVAFVAPKLDLAHPDDRDRMLTLLRRAVGRIADDRDGLTAEFFNCAAVVSTKPLPAEGEARFLVGVPYRDAAGRKVPPGAEARFPVSALPDDWPLDWPAGRFVFPEVYPAVPARKDFPPEQINLDRVLDFVLG